MNVKLIGKFDSYSLAHDYLNTYVFNRRIVKRFTTGHSNGNTIVWYDLLNRQRHCVYILEYCQYGYPIEYHVFSDCYNY